MSTLRCSPRVRSHSFTRTGRRAIYAALATSVVVIAASPGATAQSCTLTWAPGNTPAIGNPGTNGRVNAFAIFNDGSGSALYAGGGFTTAGVVSANDIAKWDGQSWSPLGSGVANPADMHGNYIAEVLALAVFDDGSGPALYAGGNFTNIGGVPANYIAKWDGQSWSPLAGGMDNEVHDLAVFNDGSGPALYVGGRFTTAGGAQANAIAKWNGQSWSPLGNGVQGGAPYTHVPAMTVFDDGTGPALYVGGNFLTAGGGAARGIAKWDGQSWSPLAGGIPGTAHTVLAMAVFDDGSGPALFAGGQFSSLVGGAPVVHLSKWDGQTWTPQTNALGNAAVLTMTVFDDGTGPALFVGGGFSSIAGTQSAHIAKWDGQAWFPVQRTNEGTNSVVSTLTSFDDGSGPALYVGGGFDHAWIVPLGGVARLRCAALNPSDINSDGVVNSADLASLLTNWGFCPPSAACGADIFPDGVVNSADLASILTHWGP